MFNIFRRKKVSEVEEVIEPVKLKRYVGGRIRKRRLYA